MSDEQEDWALHTDAVGMAFVEHLDHVQRAAGYGPATPWEKFPEGSKQTLLELGRSIFVIGWRAGYAAGEAEGYETGKEHGDEAGAERILGERDDELVRTREQLKAAEAKRDELLQALSSSNAEKAAFRQQRDEAQQALAALMGRATP